jgi:F0F1-type ATP synthase membrane subunit b/b'
MSPPDLSLIFVMVCFWVTLWIVHRFLIRPVGTVIGERRRRIDGAQHEWSAKNEEYLAAVSRIEEKVSAAARDAAGIRAEARQRAMDSRQAALDQARARADERLVAVLDALDRDADEARTDLKNRAEELARLLASRLLGRELAS